MKTLDSLSAQSVDQQMTPYERWKLDPTPENMSKVLDDLMPVINREVYRYSGPTELLRAKAKELAIQAVKTYTPDQKTKLQSWVTTNLQQLNRYGQQIRPVYTPEVSNREAAYLHSVFTRLNDELGRPPTDEELADESHFSVTKVQRLLKVKPAVISESQIYVDPESGHANYPAVKQYSNIGESYKVVYESLDDIGKRIVDYKLGRAGHAPMDNAAIAKKLGISPSAVSQRLKQIAYKILETQNVI